MAVSARATPRYAGNRWPLCTASTALAKKLLVGAGMVAAGTAPGASSAVVSESAVLREALTVRALAIEAPVSLQPLLSSMPRGVLGQDPTRSKERQLAWSFFFSGALLKLAQLQASEVLVLHYNPVLDVAVLQACQAEVGGSRVRCAEMCAMPGEHLAAQSPKTRPAWMSEADPLKALEQIASARVKAFSKERPADAGVPKPWKARYCGSTQQQIAEMRIIQGLLALERVDTRALELAVRDYLTRSEEMAATAGDERAVRYLLGSLPTLVLSGAISVSNGGWCFAFTPKKTGWRQILLLAAPGQGNSLRLRSVRIVSISSEAKP